MYQIKLKFLGFEWNFERPVKPRWLGPVEIGLLFLGIMVFIGTVALVVYNVVDIGMHGVDVMNVTLSLLGCLLLLRIVVRR